MSKSLVVLAARPAAWLPLVCLVVAASTHAATPVYADPALTCAGLTPCFATIQEAVNNAGPAPAEVGVFPGTYAESVDLSAMGSAIASGPGDISVQVLDAAGQPAISGVLIDPGAPTGPGAGPGLSAGMVDEFAGDITLRGLETTSPDSVGLGLFVAGDLVVEDVTLRGADESGMVAIVGGDAIVARGLAEFNGDTGIGIVAEGAVTLTEVRSVQNVETGILAITQSSLFMDTVESSQNADGIQAGACGTADIRNVVADLNTGNGAVIQFGPDDCMAITGGVADPRVAVSPGVSAFDPTAAVMSGPVQGLLVGELIFARENGNVGIGLGSSTGAAVLESLSAGGNMGPGIFLQAVEIDLEDAVGVDNRSGVVVFAGEAVLTEVIATDSLPMPTNPPFDGSGVVISASSAYLDDIQAEDNPAAGLVMSGPPGGGVADFELVGSEFAGNGQGAATSGNGLVNLVMDSVDASGNGFTGLTLPNLGVATLRNVVASNNALGMTVNVSGQLVVETSQITGNETGVFAEIQPFVYARIGCSDLTGNISIGVELALGDALDAPANWWGDPSGPTHPDNPAGSGDVVIDGDNGAVGTVNYDGFLAQPATVDDCPQGVPGPVSVPALDRRGIGLLAGLFVLLAAFALQRGRPVTS